MHQKKFLAFDLDGTLVENLEYVWQRLHEYFGTDPEARGRAKSDFFAHRMDYATWFAHDIQLLRNAGATKSDFRKCFKGLYLTEGTHEVLQTLKQRGHVLALISGSVDLLLEEFGLKKYFQYIAINQLIFDRRGLLVDGQPTPFDLEGKALGLKHFVQQEGMSLSDSVFIGDNVNDQHIMNTAALALGIHIKDARISAWIHREIHSLYELLDLF